jgi:hypothetical protein
MALAGEVLVELAARRVDTARGAEDARPGDPSEAVEALLGIRVVRDGGEPAIRRSDEDLADRRLDDVEAEVDEAEGGGRRTEAAIQIG